MTTPKCFLHAHYVTCWLGITIEHRTSSNLGEKLCMLLFGLTFSLNVLILKGGMKLHKKQ